MDKYNKTTHSTEFIISRSSRIWRIKYNKCWDEVFKGKTINKQVLFFEGSARQQIYESLKQKRKELALKQSIPPYVIFHEKTLYQMVEIAPKTI